MSDVAKGIGDVGHAIGSIFDPSNPLASQLAKAQQQQQAALKQSNLQLQQQRIQALRGSIGSAGSGSLFNQPGSTLG